MLYLRTFGGLSLERLGGEVPDVAEGRGRLALLAVIAASGARGVSRERLQAIFWPESDGDRARGALKQMAYMLRRDTGEPELIQGTTVLRLNPRVIESDVQAFDAACEAGAWARAVSLHAGPFLDGVHVNDGAEFDHWAAGEREQRSARRRDALRRLARDAEGRGDAPEAIACWRALAAADPLSAATCLSVMKALVHAGDRPTALAHAQAFQRTLQAELDVGADPAVEALAAEIRRELGAEPLIPVGMGAPRVAAAIRPANEARRLSVPDEPPQPPEASKHAVGWAWQRRSLGAWFGVLFLFALGIGLGATVMPGRENPEPVRFSLELEDGLELASVPGPLALSPTGRLIAFSGTRWGGRAVLHVRPVDDLSAHAVPGTAGAQQLFFSPDGHWIGYYVAGALMKVPSGGGVPVLVARVPRMLGASWLPDGRIIVSTEGRLAEVPANGGRLRPMSVPDSVAGEFAQRWPVALRDGRTILYTAYGRILEDSHIAVLSADGSRKRVLDLPGTGPLGLLEGRLVYSSARNLATDRNALLTIPFDEQELAPAGVVETLVQDVGLHVDGAAAAAVSATGSIVYLHEPAVRRQVLVQRLGGAPEVLISDTAEYRWPRFSPDGERVVVEAGGEGANHAYVFDRQSRTMGLLTPGLAGYPEWTPDGTRVLYLRPPGNGGIWWRPVDQSAAESPLIRRDSMGVMEAVFSADGQTLVVRVNRLPSLKREIWYRTSRDSILRPLVQGLDLAVGPQVSPDGRWVAYSSMDGNSRQVFVVAIPSGARHQVSEDHGWAPMWGATARELYYLHGRQLIVATLQQEPTFSVTRRAVVLAGGFDAQPAWKAPFDVSADGKELLYLRRVSEGPRVVFVQYWRDELRVPGMTATR